MMHQEPTKDPGMNQMLASAERRLIAKGWRYDPKKMKWCAPNVDMWFDFETACDVANV